MPVAESSTMLQACLDRLAAGDNKARAELLEHASCRFRKLASHMIKDFARVRRWVDTDDVFQGALMRLWRALEQVKPASVIDFSRLAALEIRRELLDLARSYYGPHGHGANVQPHNAAGDSRPNQLAAQSDSTLNPARLALWTEFHDQVEKLPDPERQVFDLLWYQGLTQKEAAALLGVSVPTVKLRWQAARLELCRRLKGERPG
jgi:RNA polymerase sigma factor (sigma-70 family)